VSHNTSKMEVVTSGRSVTISYAQPSPTIAKSGVTPGTLLFDGHRSNGQFEGTAYVFSRDCGPFPYPVSGRVEGNVLVLHATQGAPVVAPWCEELYKTWTSDQVTLRFQPPTPEYVWPQ
jgi:hypothetical protein